MFGEKLIMRRYFFYLAVVLLGFAFGSLAVFNLYRTKFEGKDFTPEPSKLVNNIETKPPSPKKNFVCEDEAAKTIWEKLKKEKDYVDWAVYITETSKVADCREIFEIKNVNLNNDKFDEVFLRGIGTLCSSGADCRAWILSKINNKYHIILELYASEFDDLIASPEKTNKYFNVEIKQNNHRRADTSAFFQFDGKKYRIKKCVANVITDELENRDYEYDIRYGKEKLILVNPKNCL